MSWSKSFEEPICLPCGSKIVTLQDAIAYLARSIPAAEHGMKQVQAAAHCITEAAENGGPMMFARIGVMQAINRHRRWCLIAVPSAQLQSEQSRRPFFIMFP